MSRRALGNGYEPIRVPPPSSRRLRPRACSLSGQPPNVAVMNEVHLGEVEKTLLYVAEARERAERAVRKLKADGAEHHLVAALEAAAHALAKDPKQLMQRTFFAAPRGDEERLAV